MAEAIGADKEHDKDGGVVHGVHHGAGRERMEAQARDAQHHADGEEHAERRKGVCQLCAVQHGETDAGDNGGEDQGRPAPLRIGRTKLSIGAEIEFGPYSLDDAGSVGRRQGRINGRLLLPFAFRGLEHHWRCGGKPARRACALHHPIPGAGERRQQKAAEGQLLERGRDGDAKDGDQPDAERMGEELVDRQLFRDRQEALRKF